MCCMLDKLQFEMMVLHFGQDKEVIHIWINAYHAVRDILYSPTLSSKLPGNMFSPNSHVPADILLFSSILSLLPGLIDTS